MLLWDDYTISKIGNNIRGVTWSHTIKYLFDSVEVSINVDDNKILCKSLFFKEGNHKFNVWIQEIKYKDSSKFDSQIPETSEGTYIFASKESSPDIKDTLTRPYQVQTSHRDNSGQMEKQIENFSNHTDVQDDEDSNFDETDGDEYNYLELDELDVDLSSHKSSTVSKRAIIFTHESNEIQQNEPPTKEVVQETVKNVENNEVSINNDNTLDFPTLHTSTPTHDENFSFEALWAQSNPYYQELGTNEA